MGKISSTLRSIRETARRKAEIIWLIAEYLLLYGWKKNSARERLTPENIIIVGGELLNKGAQAMTFTAVDQLKRNFPDKNIYLFSVYDSRTQNPKEINYTFNIARWDWKIKSGIFSSLPRRLKNTDMKKIEELARVIKNSLFFIDISGYALSSQWGMFRSINYLLNIMIAKKFGIPYYIFPQSIGPFNYRLRDRMFLPSILMKSCLRYPKMIYAREDEGLRAVQRFSRRNAKKSLDIVLQNDTYQLSNIYASEAGLREIKVEPNATGIIPNIKVTEQSNQSIAFSLYKPLITQLLERRRAVYILRHSDEDLKVCEQIKGFFSHNTNVRLLSDDFNAIELEGIIKQFDFVIASRYHSIIHAYRHGVPALVIGWAAKYHELLEAFGQSDYCFDIRDAFSIDTINAALTTLLQAHKYEKEKLLTQVSSLNKENVFNCFNGISVTGQSTVKIAASSLRANALPARGQEVSEAISAEIAR